MRGFRISASLVFACGLLMIPRADAKPRRPVGHKTSAHSSGSHTRKPAGRVTRATTRSKRGGRGRYSKHAVSASSWRNRQLAPTSDRYREIQEALSSRGYLKSAPTGSWDSESQDALKRFQADQHLDQTGKLNSLSLIALGLGPAKPESPAAAPPQP